LSQLIFNCLHEDPHNKFGSLIPPTSTAVDRLSAGTASATEEKTTLRGSSDTCCSRRSPSTSVPVSLDSKNYTFEHTSMSLMRRWSVFPYVLLLNLFELV